MGADSLRSLILHYSDEVAIFFGGTKAPVSTVIAIIFARPSEGHISSCRSGLLSCIVAD